MTRSLMVQGTTSDAGKSILVTGLCRVLHRRGIRVAPFKPQNMALNSAVTSAGGEIGRAQALQAQAAGVPAHTDMNPVLLKPSTDTAAQVIIHGQVLRSMEADRYHDYKRTAHQAVMASWERLQQQYDTLVVEGAGSPAEINLRDGDIANMGFAESADCPVVLIADIDRGGVFAHLVGTLALLSDSEQARIVGFIINRFRGDIALLQPGLDWLEKETGKPVLGVIPYLQQLRLDAEDALTNVQTGDDSSARFKVIVPVLSRISNHTDFDNLRNNPQVDLQYVGPGRPVPAADLIILPGSKNVRADLEWLRANHWDTANSRHLRYHGKLLGICGGYQMLGKQITDEMGIEGPAGQSMGLGLVDMVTHLRPVKRLQQVEARLCFNGAAARGYEIHCGESLHSEQPQPFLHNDAGEEDGFISADGQLAGTYLHGLFDTAAACDAILHWAGLTTADSEDLDQIRESEINRLADCLEQHLDLERLFPGQFAA